MGKRKKGRGRGRGPHGGPGGGVGRMHDGGRMYDGGRMRNRGRRYGNGEPQGMPYQDIEPTTENGEPLPVEPGSGVLELHPNGYGFLRNPDNNLTRERTDPFVPGTMIDKYRLREGVMVNAMVQHSRKQEGPRVKEILDIDGLKPEDYPAVKDFDALTPINPEFWLRLETGAQPLSPRVMDLLTPLGKGQRALIVAPPRTGKTILLQQISQAISENYPDMHLVMLLIDARPEEVTDMRRSVKGDVIASSLDRDVESHVRLAQIVVERCKRLAEMGKDVFLLMDSITRMARAFNKVTRGDRTATGGLDIRALDIPKKLFATARLFEEGGSLTIAATALIDTGSRMDEAIFQEF